MNRFGRLAAPVVLLALAGCQIWSSAEQIAETVSADGQNKSHASFDALRARDPQSKIGAKGHPKVLKANGGVYQNQKLEELLALVTGQLVTHSQDPERAYDITILNSPTINAFALPGGYLYVTRGLLALANDASEVAAVLAHEMAHVSSNHGIQRSKQARVVSIAERVASEVVSNPVVAKVVKASTEQRLAAFSKRQELQADAVGIKHLGASGFDPFAASRFLRSMDRFGEWRSALNTSGADMSSSHPSTPRRIELARRHARRLGPVGSRDRNRRRYLSGIDGMEFGGSTKDGIIRNNRFFHPKLGFTFAAPSQFELINRKDAVLVSGPDQMALRFDAVVKKQRTPTDHLVSGWVNGLKTETVKKLTINSLPAASAEAAVGDWNFIVTVVELDKRYYRFIMAAPRSAQNIATVGNKIPSSFRRIRPSEKTSLKPLRLKIATVGKSDTIASMANRMRGVSRKLGLFRALNGLDVGDRLKRGAKVKIVVD